jgi:replicative DNA helicase
VSKNKQPLEGAQLPMPPHSLEAEQALLGAILLRPEVLDEIIDLVAPEDFYRDGHAKSFRAIRFLYNNNTPVDLVTLCQQLADVGWLEKAGGAVYLAELSEHVGTAANAAHYAKTIKEKAILRRLIDVSQGIIAKCLGNVEGAGDLIGQAEEEIYQIRDGRESTVVYSLDEIVPPEVEHIEQLFDRKNEILGVPSGFDDLDSLTGGWQPSDLIILAARPSHGKTAMALNMSHHAAADQGEPVLFVSLEQPKEQLVQRLIASTGMINAHKMRHGRLSQPEWDKFSNASAELLDVPLFIVDKPALSLTEIRAIARREVKRHGIKMVIVDYLQLVREAKTRNREQEVGNISRGLKALAKELMIPVVALCQLSREVEKRPGKVPQLSDLRESGSIEQDADVVVFIFRGELYKDSAEKGRADILLSKQRNGPTGHLALAYLEEYMAFKSLEE